MDRRRRGDGVHGRIRFLRQRRRCATNRRTSAYGNTGATSLNHPDPGTNPDTNADTNRNAESDAYSRADQHTYSYSDSDSGTSTKRAGFSPDRYSRPVFYSDTSPNTDQHASTDANRYSSPSAHSYDCARTHRYAYSDGYFHAGTHRYAVPDSDGYPAS